MPDQFSCTITIGDKPDWDKLGPEIMDGFLLPLAEMVKNNNAGVLDCKFLNREDCRITLDYSLGNYGSGAAVYSGHIKNDTRVAVFQAYKNHPYPTERISLKEFLTNLAQFFAKTFEERTKQYAEAAAIGTIIQGTMARLRSIKATAHYE